MISWMILNSGKEIVLNRVGIFMLYRKKGLKPFSAQVERERAAGAVARSAGAAARRRRSLVTASELKV